ncbi:hypothetical protein B0H10DRAFT_1946098 [Mycena sp. CBHHK59/15]|nr:hypothetical protein B0H10DRAFT_1946098 [Mycena sp. CBHHK59/15]
MSTGLFARGFEKLGINPTTFTSASALAEGPCGGTVWSMPILADPSPLQVAVNLYQTGFEVLIGGGKHHTSYEEWSLIHPLAEEGDGKEDPFFIGVKVCVIGGNIGRQGIMEVIPFGFVPIKEGWKGCVEGHVGVQGDGVSGDVHLATCSAQISWVSVPKID